MNIGPVQHLPGENEVRNTEPQVRAAKPQEQKAEIASAQIAVHSTPVPPVEQDVVRLQWDPSAHLRIYKFVTQSGALILQIPSEQMLGVTRGIQESFEQEAQQKEAIQKLPEK
jgi:hypothetical protein